MVWRKDKVEIGNSSEKVLTMRSTWLPLALLPFTALVLGAMPDEPQDLKSAKFAPVIFGTYEGNVGCVILNLQSTAKKKPHATGTIAAAGEYEVVQTFHYQMRQTKFQGQKGADELNRIGQREKIKFVVIPARHTLDQLNVAWDECKKGLVAQTPPPAAAEELAKTRSRETSVAPGVTPPEGTHQPEPAYTDEARKAGIEGIVELLITVDDGGSVSDVRVTKSLGYGLDEEAVKAVRTWKFKPALKAGKPVPVSVRVEVSFKLRRQTE